jgi:glucose-6-phosphate 1-dehydrogenase
MSESVSMAGTAVRPRDDLTLVIFGATGDLTHRKLMPALYAMHAGGLLPGRFAVVAFARRPFDDASYRAAVAESIRRFGRVPAADSDLAAFLDRVFYQRADFEQDAGAFRALRDRLALPEFPDNALFYLSVTPELFPLAIERLSGEGLLPRGDVRPWRRIVIEKPFGRDLASARDLNRLCLKFLDEPQIYRIDHYLGKETVQNILSFRFANAIFEPLFTNRYVDHVQITAAETVGMEGGRGAFYDATGALRDMMQNHLLQLLCLVAMEPPSRLTADAIRNEKVKVLQSVRPPSPGCVDSLAIRAQYGAGAIDGRPARAYREEDRVAPDSRTPTFAALRVGIENWRWAGVPFCLRTGKRLARRATEIMVQFKVPPLELFQTVECVGDACDFARAKPNRLVFRIQPSEGIALRFSAKRPVLQMHVEDVEMDFSYSDTWKRELPEAYERLLLDVMRGDSTLFTRSDEVEEAWRIVDPILRAWETLDASPLYAYPAGSWGPPEAEAVFADCDAEWHDPA